MKYKPITFKQQSVHIFMHIHASMADFFIAIPTH